MANAYVQKKGLTTFGWLALAGVVTALLSSKERRDRIFNGARDFASKFTPSSSAGSVGAQA